MLGVERFGLVVSWLVLIGSCFGLAFLELPDRGYRFTVVVIACVSALTSFLLTKRWLDPYSPDEPDISCRQVDNML